MPFLSTSPVRRMMFVFTIALGLSPGVWSAETCYRSETDYCLLPSYPGALSSVSCQGPTKEQIKDPVPSGETGVKKGELCGKWNNDVRVFIDPSRPLSGIKKLFNKGDACGQVLAQSATCVEP